MSRKFFFQLSGDKISFVLYFSFGFTRPNYENCNYTFAEITGFRDACVYVFVVLVCNDEENYCEHSKNWKFAIPESWNLTGRMCEQRTATAVSRARAESSWGKTFIQRLKFNERWLLASALSDAPLSYSVQLHIDCHPFHMRHNATAYFIPHYLAKRIKIIITSHFFRCSSAQTDVDFSATHIFHVFYFDASILLSIRPAALHLNKHAKRKRVFRNWHRTLWSASRWINCHHCYYHLTENYSNLLHTSAWQEMHFTNADNVIEVFIFPLYSW